MRKKENKECCSGMENVWISVYVCTYDFELDSLCDVYVSICTRFG